jgi:NAD(P)-dependent dehydrogenase (short-subunit alcohol dehydrogenase family)
MQTIVITGASGNLGRAVVKKFLNENWRVIGIDMREHAENKHENFKHIAVDLTNETSVEKFVRDIINEYQTIEAAVLTAGGFAMGKIADTKVDEIQKQISLNFETAYNISRQLFSHMIEKNSGRLFFIGSRPGSDMRNSKGMVAYGLSKSLVFRLVELMNEEAKGKNVVAMVVVPSTIDTPENRKSMPEADPSKWVKAENIAAIIYFYCSEAASVIREPVVKVYHNA